MGEGELLLSRPGSPSSASSSSSAPTLLSLPPELFSHLIQLLLASPPRPPYTTDRSALRSALALCSSSQRLWASHPASVVRYLAALHRHGFPLPRVPLVPGGNGPIALSRERKLLEGSSWCGSGSGSGVGTGSGKVGRQTRGVKRRKRCRLSGIEASGAGQARLVGRKVWDVLRDGEGEGEGSRSRLAVWDIEGVGAGEVRESGPEAADRVFEASTAMGRIVAYDVDEDEGVVSIAYASPSSDSSASPEEEQTLRTPKQAANGDSTTDIGIDGSESHPPDAAEDLCQLQVYVFDITSGRQKTSAPFTRSTFAGDLDSLQLEVCADVILLRIGEEVELRRWRELRRTSEADASESNGSTSKSWSLVWSRSPTPDSPQLLSANLVGPLIFLLSKPPASSQGQDWGSTLSLYLPSSSQPLTAEIRLPVRSRPVRGLSYTRTGLGKRLRNPYEDNALVVICVEGFVWVGELRSFLELAFPKGGAVSLWGEEWITLDSHWVRGNLHKCSLTSMDAHPHQPVSISGFRLIAIWSRRSRTASISNGSGDGGSSSALASSNATSNGINASAAAAAPSNGAASATMDPSSLEYRFALFPGTAAAASTDTATIASTSLFLRILNAHPDYSDGNVRPAGEGEEAGEEEQPQIHTMFTGSRFYAYCDHDLTSSLSSTTPIPPSSTSTSNGSAAAAPPAPPTASPTAPTTAPPPTAAPLPLPLPSAMRVHMDGPRVLLTAPGWVVLSTL